MIGVLFDIFCAICIIAGCVLILSMIALLVAFIIDSIKDIVE